MLVEAESPVQTGSTHPLITVTINPLEQDEVAIMTILIMIIMIMTILIMILIHVSLSLMLKAQMYSW